MRALEKYDVPAPVHRHLPPLGVCHVSIIGSGLPSSPRSRASLPTSQVRPCSPSHWSSPAQRCPTQSSPAGTCCTTWTLPWRTSIRDRVGAACSHRRCSTCIGILADHHFGVARDVDAAEYSEEALVAIDAVDLERALGEIDEGATCSTTSGRRSMPRKSGAARTWTYSPKTEYSSIQAFNILT
jgi:hypothetical protein